MRLLSIVLTFVTLLSSAILHAQSNNEEELEKIQSEIKGQQASLKQKMTAAQSLQEQLRVAELEISALAKQLIINERQLSENQKEQQQLLKQQKSLQQQKDQQTALLSKQIKAAFMAGNHDYTKMLLNQENAGKFERMLVYYDYLNKARQQQISTFNETLQELSSVTEQLQAKRTQINDLLAQQQEKSNELQGQQKSREVALAQIQTTIDSQAAQIEQLQINEQQLAQAITEALERQNNNLDIELTGLSGAKGKLPKPTEGRYRRLFGKRRQGQVRWKGVIFEGDSGQPVSAIHQGKVLYADWLKGLGLVTVVDHGDGFMSLYGHNQALLRQAGDFVDAGETIALLGQSGGQNRAGLYFELRHRGEAINPSKWLKI